MDYETEVQEAENCRFGMKEATDGRCYYLPTEDWGWGDYSSEDRPEIDDGDD